MHVSLKKENVVKNQLLLQCLMPTAQFITNNASESIDTGIRNCLNYEI